MPEIKELGEIADSLRAAHRIVLVTGNFNVLHSGHLRLLRFAKECGELLVVGINSDSLINNPSYANEQHRCEVVGALDFIDHCFIARDDVGHTIGAIRPAIVVKGVEHKSLLNPEREALQAYGGRLVFGSGDFSLKTSSIGKSAKSAPTLSLHRLNGFLNRHNTSIANIRNIVAKFSQFRVAVIGDLIVDQYVQCHAVGMSQEDPTIVVTPNDKKFFLGGAGITAAHAKSLGAREVNLYTVTGQDESRNFALAKLDEYNLNAYAFIDETRPTSLKTRYRVGSKTMLRVNELRNHDIQQDLQDQIWLGLQDALLNTDVLLFSDFNYGVLPQSLVDNVIRFCKSKHIIMAADSQSSSQVGDISRFLDMDLVTPTEREARLALGNNKDGLVQLSEKLRKKCRAQNIVITLAEDGAFLHWPNNQESSMEPWLNDKIAALATNPIDPAGAGDCFLAAATLALATKASFWEAALVGSIAAACQVSQLGNTPLQQRELVRALREL